MHLDFEFLLLVDSLSNFEGSDLELECLDGVPIDLKFDIAVIRRPARLDVLQYLSRCQNSGERAKWESRAHRTS
jgi:hypothetical protein